MTVPMVAVLVVAVPGVVMPVVVKRGTVKGTTTIR